MKVLLLSLFSLFALILLSNCTDSTGPYDTENSLFPVEIGSYWIYETKLDNVSEGTVLNSRDSMVVISRKMSGNYTEAELEYYQDNELISTFSIKVNSNELLLKSQALAPFLIIDSSTCMSSSPDTLKLIIDFQKDFVKHSSIKYLGSEAPSRLEGNYLGFPDVMHIFEFLINNSGIRNTDYNNEPISCNQYHISLSHLVTLIDVPNHIRYKKFECDVSEDGQTLTQNLSMLDISFTEGIGIVETSGNVMKCTDTLFIQSRKLVDYNVIIE